MNKKLSHLYVKFIIEDFYKYAKLNNYLQIYLQKMKTLKLFKCQAIKGWAD